MDQLLLMLTTGVAAVVMLFVRLLQEFVVPVWFTGLAPAIAYAFDAVIFKAIEKAKGVQLPTATKRLVLGAFSLVCAVFLVAIGQSPLPMPPPIIEHDPILWGTFVTVSTAYIFAGATLIFIMIEAAKAVMGKAKPSLPEPTPPTP
jgi:hypothetical protein